MLLSDQAAGVCAQTPDKIVPRDGTEYVAKDFFRLDVETAGVVAAMCNQHRDAESVLKRAGYGARGESLADMVRMAVAQAGRKWL